MLSRLLRSWNASAQVRRSRRPRSVIPAIEVLERRDCPSTTPAVAPVPIRIFGTGQTSSGSALAPGAVDPHYKILLAPPAGQPDAHEPIPAYLVRDTGFPFNGYWSGPGWIAPHPDENDFAAGTTEPEGTYDYRTAFSLAGLDPASARLALSVAADNEVTVLLNGQQVFQSTGPRSYLHPVDFSITSGFQEGQNHLDFLVTNLHQDAWSNNLHNPSGLQVSVAGTADPYRTITLAWADSEMDSTHLAAYTVPLVNGTTTPVVYPGVPVQLGASDVQVDWGDGRPIEHGDKPDF